jgi:cytochrome c556
LVWPLLVSSLIVPVGATAQTIVSGPWGDIVDHQKPLALETDKQRVTLLRRNQMRAISGHFRSIEAVVTYRAPISGTLEADANALAAAASTLSSLFPQGTEMDPGKFGAKQEIWQLPEKFARHNVSFRQSVERFSTAITTKADLTAPLNAIRHECLACHQAFRSFESSK